LHLVPDHTHPWYMGDMKPRDAYTVAILALHTAATSLNSTVSTLVCSDTLRLEKRLAVDHGQAKVFFDTRE